VSIDEAAGLTMLGSVRLIGSTLVIVLHNREQEIEREFASPADAARVALMMLARRGRLEIGDVLKAALAGADRELEFVAGHPLGQESADQIPANMMGRFLDDGDLRKLHRTLLKKKPPAPSVRRRATGKRSVGK
jgi:hypothetical protein